MPARTPYRSGKESEWDHVTIPGRAAQEEEVAALALAARNLKLDPETMRALEADRQRVAREQPLDHDQIEMWLLAGIAVIALILILRD